MASGKLGKRSTVILVSVLLIGITVFFNRTVTNIGLGRFDFTEGKIYTVSKSAKNIMSALDVPVMVTYYVTPKDEMPAGLKSLQQDVVDKLKELSIASDGLLSYRVVNPKESETIEEDVAKKGIRPMQVQSVDRDELAVKLVYSALAIGYKDKADEVIPSVLPESLRNFEYDLLSNVLRTTREKNPVVAVYSTKEPVDPQLMQLYMQMGQQPPPPEDHFGNASEALRSEGYDVRATEISKDRPIPDDAETLLLLAPRDLEERQRYEVARMLRRGGNVIVAAQAFNFDYTPGSRGGFEISAKKQPIGANDLLDPYGVRIDDRLLMDDQMATLAIPRTANFAGMRLQLTEPVQSPIQIRVLPDGYNPDLPLTAGVPEMLYLWGSQVITDEEKLKTAGLEATPIFRGGPKSWTLERDAGGLLTSADFDPEKGTPVERPLLGVMIEGTFPDPWEGRPAPTWRSAASDSAAPAEVLASVTPEPGRLIVLGCSKLFEDMLLQQQGHLLFLLNSVDAVTLGDDLINVRSKAYEQRTLGEVSAQKRLGFRFANMVLVPVAVVVFGLARLAVRRRESDEYAARYSASAGGR